MPGFLDRLFGRHRDDALKRSAGPADGFDEDDQHDGPSPGQVEQQYLEFVGGTSAKFYAVVLHGDDDDAWSVWFNYGRIGHPRDWATKVADVDEDEARDAFDALVADKVRGGYEDRPWPATLTLPGGTGVADGQAGGGGRTATPASSDGPTAYVATSAGTLPAASGDRVGGIELPGGVLVAPDDGAGGPPVIWISATAVDDVASLWRRLVAAFPETGLWPLVMELDMEPDGMAEIFHDPGQASRRDARAILAEMSSGNDDDGDRGGGFRALAAPTPGSRPVRIEDRIGDLAGHLGLVAVTRPADVLAVTGWTGAANYDFDPRDMSAVLRSWEARFDAYLVGLGWDTIHVAVGRPPGDRQAATAIGIEHYAFCPDNIDQGVGELKPYAQDLVGATMWPFWWD